MSTNVSTGFEAICGYSCRGHSLLVRALTGLFGLAFVLQTPVLVSELRVAAARGADEVQVQSLPVGGPRALL